MSKKEDTSINWARVWRKWQRESMEMWVYFMVNSVDIAFYSLVAYVEYMIVTSFTDHVIYVFAAWVGTALALGNCILRRLKDLPEDVWLEMREESHKGNDRDREQSIPIDDRRYKYVTLQKVGNVGYRVFINEEFVEAVPISWSGWDMLLCSDIDDCINQALYLVDTSIERIDEFIKQGVNMEYLQELRKLCVDVRNELVTVKNVA